MSVAVNRTLALGPGFSTCRKGRCRLQSSDGVQGSNTMAENTLGLAGDMDDVVVVVGAEGTFGIKFTDSELRETHTVGQFYDLVLRKHRAAHPATQACLTQAAFYRVRRALKDLGVNRPVTPATPLASVLPPPADRKAVRQAWKQIAVQAGLTLPRLETPWKQSGPMSRWGALTFWITGYALVFAIAIALAGLTDIGVGWWLFLEFATIFALGIVGSLLAAAFLATAPRRLKTVGDLAGEVAGHNFVELQRDRGSAGASDVWHALITILRSVTAHKGPIDRETTFFAKT